MWVQTVPGGGVNVIAFAPDGRTLYTRDRGLTLTAWDVATRTRRHQYCTRRSFLNSRAIYPLPDGRVVGVGDEISIWNGTSVKSDEKDETAFGRPAGRHLNGAVHVTPDGRALFLDENGFQITGLDLNTGAPFPPRNIPDEAAAFRFAVAPDEKVLAVSFRTKVPVAIYEWTDEPGLRKLAALKDAWEVRFSPDGRTLALCSAGPPLVDLWDTATWQPRVENIPCWITENTFAINPVLPVFAAIYSGSLTLYSLETGAIIRSLDFELGRRALCVCFSPDGLTCAVGGSNKRFAVFDVDL